VEGGTGWRKRRKPLRRKALTPTLSRRERGETRNARAPVSGGPGVNWLGGQFRRKPKAPRVRLEQEPNSSGNPPFAARRDAFSDALSGDFTSIDPELAWIIRVWPTLPPPTREAVLVLVQAVAGRREQHEANGDQHGEAPRRPIRQER
jgi:hypothetical protein